VYNKQKKSKKKKYCRGGGGDHQKVINVRIAKMGKGVVVESSVEFGYPG